MASRSLGLLTLDLVAKIGGFTKGMTEAERASDKSARAIAARQKQSAQAVQQAWSAALRFVGGVFAVKEIIQAADTYTLLSARIKLVSKDTQEFAQAQAEVLRIANESRVGLEQTATLYTQISRSVQGLGISQKDVLGVTQSINQALLISGGSADSAKAAITQLSQAFASGVLRGEEFNSVAEQAPRVLQAIATGVGVGIGELREMAKEGELTATRVIKALQSQAAVLEAEAKGIPLTIGQAVTQASNALLVFIGSVNESTRTTEGLASALGDAAGWFNDLAIEIQKANKGSEDVGFLATAFTVVSQTVRILLADVVFVFKGIRREVGAVAAQIGALATLDIKGFRAISDAVTEDAKRARAELDKYQFQVLNPFLNSRGRGTTGGPDPRLIGTTPANETVGYRPPRGDPKDKNAATKAREAAAVLKKQLDNELAALQRSIEEQSRLLSERNKFLDLFNGLGLLSIEDYYQRQANIRDEATQAQVKAYDAQIKALRDFQAKAPKGSDRLEVEGKINDLLEKQANLQRDAGSAAIVAGLEQARAAKDYQDSINDVNASILEMTGYLKEAAAIRFDKQIEGLTKSVAANGSADDKAALDRYRQLTIAQAEFGDKAKDIATINETLRMQEERIALSRQLGFDGEISSLAKLGEARKETVAQMEAIVQAQEAIARASENPVLIRNAEQARLALDQLAATVDPLAERFNTMFADSASNAFGDFINGTKSAKDAFRSFIDDIFSQLLNMIAKDLFKQLFSGVFGGSGGGGFNFGSVIAGFFGGGKAAGGAVTAGGMYRVNENGPEMLEMNGQSYLMMGSRSGNVNPRGVGPSVNNYFTVGENVDRRTQAQIALAAQRGVALGSRNA